MAEFVDSETSKKEGVTATTSDVASEAPAPAPLASQAAAEGGEGTVMESTSAEPTTPGSTNVMVESVKAGASAAQETVANFWPAVGRNLRKFVYNGCYYVSFGVTFSALTVANLVPTDNIMGKALADGAEAAKEAFHKQHELAASGESGSALNPASGEGLVAA